MTGVVRNFLSGFLAVAVYVFAIEPSMDRRNHEEWFRVETVNDGRTETISLIYHSGYMKTIYQGRPCVMFALSTYEPKHLECMMEESVDELAPIPRDIYPQPLGDLKILKGR